MYVCVSQVRHLRDREREREILNEWSTSFSLMEEWEERDTLLNDVLVVIWSSSMRRRRQNIRRRQPQELNTYHKTSLMWILSSLLPRLLMMHVLWAILIPHSEDSSIIILISRMGSLLLLTWCQFKSDDLSCKSFVNGSSPTFHSASLVFYFYPNPILNDYNRYTYHPTPRISSIIMILISYFWLYNSLGV